MLSLKELAEVAKRLHETLFGEKPSSELAIVWNEEVRRDYIKWMQANGRSEKYISTCLYYLDKYMSGREVREPDDIVDIFSKCKRGVNNLVKALRTLFNYYLEVKGYPEEFINSLRRPLPRETEGVDLQVPTEEEVIKALRELNNGLLKYKALYWFVLATGIRKEHAISILNQFDLSRVTKIGSFNKYAIGMRGRTKAALIALFPDFVRDLIEELVGSGAKITPNGVTMYARKHRLVHVKYIRKFAYNAMIKAGIPESVADFLHGRAPRTVGSKHYLALADQADSHYPKYLRYLERLWRDVNS